MRPGDPRETITPDAFTVAPELLGRPLARPWRRAAAMAVDGILVALLANATAALFGFAAAAALFRASARTEAGGLARRSARVALRVVAAVVLFVVVVAAWDAVGSSGDDEPPRTEDAALVAGIAAPERAAPDSAFGAGADSLARAYAAALDAADSSTVAALREELAVVLSADTLDALSGRIERLERRARRRAEALEEARRDGGLRAWLRDVADELGLGLGWAGLYFTVSLALWGGRTPGKRLLGIRVLRLTGEPVGWWIAFERFGGYAASAATALLGFARIFWDSNRQAMHDKIVDTVVIRERGAARTDGDDGA